MRTREFRLARTATVTAIMLVMFVVVAANRDDVVQAQRLASVLVTVKSDGEQRQVRTAQTTVGATLKDAGVEVGPRDMVTPATNERPRDGMRIAVVRVREAVEVVSAPIAYDTVRTFTKDLRPGILREARPGVRGEKQVRYLARYEDGQLVKRVALVSEVVKKPRNRVIAVGSKGQYTSRGEFRTRSVMRMRATAYDPGPRSCGKHATGITACGLQAGYGVVAVDPSVIRLGSKLYIEGYGYAIAGDRGRAIKGNRIDLGFGTYSEAIRFGQKSVIVHILED